MFTSVAASVGVLSVPPGHDSSALDNGAGSRTLSGRYRLDRAIGQGGVGVVWQARDLQLGRDVAVKQLQLGLARDAVAAERFRREATTAASLTHRSMVTIFDVGEHDGVPYLVMELVDGPSLATVLSARGALSVAETIAIGHPIASALSVAHARGLVHRDVKPGNVLLGSTGPPRLVDFGSVRMRGEGSADLTMPGTMLGTIGYVAPEQLEGQPSTPRTDVFALGLVLYECLVGEPAFGTGSVAELTRRRLDEQVPAPSRHRSDIPPVLDQLVIAATRRDPAQRPADGAVVAEVLAPMIAAAAEGQPETAAAPSPLWRSSNAPVQAADADDADHEPAAAEATSVLPTAPVNAAARPVPAQDGAPQVPVATDLVDQIGTSPPHAATAVTRSSGDDRFRRIVIPLVALVALAVVGLFIGLDPFGGGSDRTIDANAVDSSGESSEAGGASVAIADASDFDPLSDAGNEHPENIALAHDGDPATAWQTEGYNAPDLAPKAGVGMWVRADAAASHVAIDLSNAGVTVSLYAFDAVPGDDPAAWGEPVQTWTDASGTVATDVPDSSKVLLVWFTRLSADGGRYRGGINEIRLS